MCLSCHNFLTLSIKQAGTTVLRRRFDHLQAPRMLQTVTRSVITAFLWVFFNSWAQPPPTPIPPASSFPFVTCVGILMRSSCCPWWKHIMKSGVRWMVVAVFICFGDHTHWEDDAGQGDLSTSSKSTISSARRGLNTRFIFFNQSLCSTLMWWDCLPGLYSHGFVQNLRLEKLIRQHSDGLTSHDTSNPTDSENSVVRCKTGDTLSKHFISLLCEWGNGNIDDIIDWKLDK